MRIDREEVDQIPEGDFESYTANVMLDALNANFLEVMIDRENRTRMVIMQNAAWYRDFCRQYENTRSRRRKMRTFIKRCDTVKALKRIIAGDTSGVYAERLLGVIGTFWDDYAC